MDHIDLDESKSCDQQPSLFYLLNAVKTIQFLSRLGDFIGNEYWRFQLQ